MSTKTTTYEDTIPKEERCPSCRGKGGRNKYCRSCKQHVAWKPCGRCNGTGRRGEINPAWAARQIRSALGYLRNMEREARELERMLRADEYWLATGEVETGFEYPERYRNFPREEIAEFVARTRDYIPKLRAITNPMRERLRASVSGWRESLGPELGDALYGDLKLEPLQDGLIRE